MKICEFMEKKKMTYRSFGDKIGVSASNARFWALRVTSPSLYHAIQINKMSKNKIRFSDMLNLADGDRNEENKNK